MGGKNRQKTPLTMLLSSHHKLLDNLDKIEQLAHSLMTSDAPTGHVSEAIGALHNYFQTSVFRHEQDEEISIFPRVKDYPAMADILAELTEQHLLQKAPLHQLGQILDALQNQPTQPRRQNTGHTLLVLVLRLRKLYTSHFTLEETAVFPVWKHTVSQDQKDIALQEMRARRGK